jgi:hypothetical protein
VTRDFGTGTRGFAAADDPGLAVCVMPGTWRAISLIRDEARRMATNSALPLRSATTPRGAVDRGRASVSRRRGRSLETVAPRMLGWSSFRMRQQEMMQDMK